MEAIIQLDERHCGELGRLNRLLIEDEGHSNTMSEQQLTKRMRRWLAGDYYCHGIVDGDKILAFACTAMTAMIITFDNSSRTAAVVTRDWLSSCSPTLSPKSSSASPFVWRC